MKKAEVVDNTALMTTLGGTKKQEQHSLRGEVVRVARSLVFPDCSRREEVVRGVRFHPLRQAMLGTARSMAFLEQSPR